MDFDPRAGEQRYIDEVVHPTMHSACIGLIVLLIGVLLAGVYTYCTGGSSSLTSDNGTSAATTP